MLQLDDLWGRDGKVLRERLLEAPTRRLKFRVFEEVLLQYLGAELRSRNSMCDRSITVRHAAVASSLTPGSFAQDTPTSLLEQGRDHTQAVCACASSTAGVTRSAPFR